jgi:hypothetical protein
VGSEDDAKDNESDQSGSGFGPPLDDFGPPVSEFGPPVGEFGPPVGEFGPSTRGKAPQWQVPEPATDHPELIWRPADEPPTPPPPATYRAPDTTVFPDGPPPAAPPARQPQPPADSDEDLTVRHATPPAGVDRDTWWNRPTESGGVPTPPAESLRRSDSAGLSWSDDPIVKRLAPSPAFPTPGFTPNRKNGSRGRWIVLGAVAAIAVVVALVVTIVAVNRDSGGDGGVAAPPPAATTAALSCPTSREGKVTVGNGAGDAASGPGAILGFQYSFYVERSGERARRFVDPEALNVSTADIIQQAINDQIPVGTTHCLRIIELATDTFDVDLTEHRIDGVTTVYRQTVTTTNRDGKTLIYAIKERA